tara:strand:- start:3543 stop:4175 length:633 start_codon:yes stop_codon:yes gene_type:complete
MERIFIDFDGVIVDSNKFKETAIETSIIKLLGKNKKNTEAINYFNLNAGISRNLKLSKFFKKEDISKILKIYNEECLDFFSKVYPTKGFREFLDHIKCRINNVKFYVLSGGEKGEIEFFLKKNLLFDYFEEILASEKNKFDHLVEKDVSENDIFIGDSNNDLKAALKINIKFILFKKYKSLKSFPSKEFIKKHVFLETDDFKSLIKEIAL